MNSLSPAFVKINYASAFGAHVQTLPSVPLIAGAYAPTGYAFVLRGLEVPVAVDDAVTDFVNLERAFFPSSVIFTDATVYSQPSPSDVPVPVASFPLGIAGTNAAVGWSKAVQLTLTFRASDFTLFKLVELDAESYNLFDKTTDKTERPELEAIVDYVTADASWLASRGGGKPSTFLQEAKTLNEKLRRSYNMT